MFINYIKKTRNLKNKSALITSKILLIIKMQKNAWCVGIYEFLNGGTIYSVIHRYTRLVWVCQGIRDSVVCIYARFAFTVGYSGSSSHCPIKTCIYWSEYRKRRHGIRTDGVETISRAHSCSRSLANLPRDILLTRSPSRLLLFNLVIYVRAKNDFWIQWNPFRWDQIYFLVLKSR